MVISSSSGRCLCLRMKVALWKLASLEHCWSFSEVVTFDASMYMPLSNIQVCCKHVARRRDYVARCWKVFAIMLHGAAMCCKHVLRCGPHRCATYGSHRQVSQSGRIAVMGEGSPQVGVWESESQGQWIEESRVSLAEVQPTTHTDGNASQHDLSRSLSRLPSSLSASTTSLGGSLSGTWGGRQSSELSAIRVPKAAAWFPLSCGYSLFSIVTGSEVLLYAQERRGGANKPTPADMGCSYQCAAYISRPAGSKAQTLAYLCDGTLTVAAGAFIATGP
jgi:hypothetical protein